MTTLGCAIGTPGGDGNLSAVPTRTATATETGTQALPSTSRLVSSIAMRAFFTEMALTSCLRWNTRTLALFWQPLT